MSASVEQKLEVTYDESELDSLNAAKAIIMDFRCKELHNEPALRKLRSISEHLTARQHEITAAALSDPEAAQ